MVRIRPFKETEPEWEILAHTQSAYWDTFPISAKRARHRRLLMPEGSRYVGLIASRDGLDVGTAICFDAVWISEPGQIYFLYSILPDELGTDLEAQLFAAILEVAEKMNSAGIHTEVESRRPRNVELLEKAGFDRVSMSVFSEMDLLGLSGEALSIRHAVGGIRVVSLQELPQTGPDWKKRYVEVSAEAMKGMPSYTEQEPLTLELFEKLLVAPGYDLSLRFVAVQDDGEYVGITSMQPSPVDPHRFSTGATGVRPEHRRRGIASMLKAHALVCAQRQGARVVGTENEETNPMLELNYKLGFKKRFDIYSYLRRP
jgi:GNAT superfamily N-acetyltransferase